MTLETLRRRAARKRARIVARRGVYTVIDTANDEVVTEVDNLLALEDSINWLDTP